VIDDFIDPGLKERNRKKSEAKIWAENCSLSVCKNGMVRTLAGIIQLCRSVHDATLQSLTGLSRKSRDAILFASLAL